MLSDEEGAAYHILLLEIFILPYVAILKIAA